MKKQTIILHKKTVDNMIKVSLLENKMFVFTIMFLAVSFLKMC